MSFIRSSSFMPFFSSAINFSPFQAEDRTTGAYFPLQRIKNAENANSLYSNKETRRQPYVSFDAL